MKDFFRRISPRRAVTDFRDHWQQPTPHRWQIMGVAMAATFCVFMLFVPESARILPRPPEVIYISTFEEGRAEAEIIASNCENQQLQNELAEIRETNAEARREMYRALGRATFVDVDEMEADIAEQEAADATDDTGPTEEELALSFEEYCSRAANG